MTIKLIVAGATGQYGKKTLSLARANKAFSIVGEVDSHHSLEKCTVPGAVVVDFSTPDASVHHARLCAEHGMSSVIATTGFSEVQRQFIHDAARLTPIVLTPNTSLGVNLILKWLSQAATTLPEYAVSLSETHHTRKKDAPSGTALRMLEALELDPSDIYFDLPEGSRGNPNARVQVKAVRDGDVIGVHTVTFRGPNEIITITHTATDRTLFAEGALIAAQWVAHKAPGLYNMWDVLGLK